MQKSQASTRSVLITLGRLPPAVDIARSFHNAGWRVIVADPFALHMARTSAAVDISLRVPAPVAGHAEYIAALLEIIDAHDISLVVPVSEETMHVSALSERLTGQVALFSMDHRQTLRLHSKYEFVTLAAAAGLSVPATARAGSEACADIADSGDYVIKPEFSCSGRGVATRGAGDSIVDTSLHSLVVQRHVHGDELSGFAMARDGRVLASSIYRARVRHGSVAVAFERVDHAGVQAWMAAFIAAQRHTGFIAFDFIVDDNDEPFAIECNPRATSGLHFIDVDDIAPLITGEADAARLRTQRNLQEFWSNWTHLLSVLRRADERRDTWRAIRESRDVTWSRRDPWVFLLAVFSTWPIIGRAIRRRESFAEVLALDIEWRGDDA